MPANFAAEAGQGQINLFEIESNYGKSLDISASVVEFTYYESILDNTIRANATIVDTGYRNSEEGHAIPEEKGVKLTTGEKVNIKITDGYDTTLSFLNQKHLILKLPKQETRTTNKVSFNIELYTPESVNNKLEPFRVKTRYDGKISDTVQKILSQVLKTPKNLDIDPTLNKLSLLPTNTMPFYQCTWLGPRSIPDLGNSSGSLAGFFFFENYDGFKFKSIDKLFQQKPKKRFIYNDIIGEVPPGYSGKILVQAFTSSLDLDTILFTGSHVQQKLKAANSYESAYRENVFDSKSQFRPENIGGKEQPLVATSLEVQQQASSISYVWDDPGFLVEGKNLLNQLPKSTYVNYNKDEILRQSRARYNNLFSIKLSIAIAGDFSLHAGDLIYCDFPEITSSTTKLVADKISGIYMIADVCHRLTKTSCYTRLNLVRESIGRKPFK